MRRYDGPTESEFVQYLDPSSEMSVHEIVEHIRPDGFVCPNDITAATLMQTLNHLGIAIPADVRIVGIDDVKYASLLHVPLKTLHQPCQDIGVAALKVMLDRIANPSLPAWDVLLDFRLVIRRSCGSRLNSLLVSEHELRSDRIPVGTITTVHPPDGSKCRISAARLRAGRSKEL